ncbi:MAG TPA: hypothetical protein DCQ52_12890 [Acidimicrobiaceae bacterium]|nr:hypothetical protein [Acidimicrobiaceae bacterium]
MRELVGGKAIGDVGQRAQQHQHTVGDARLVAAGFFADHRPLLGGRFVHAGEGGCHASQSGMTLVA